MYIYLPSMFWSFLYFFLVDRGLQFQLMMSREWVCRSDLHTKADRQECRVYVGFICLEKAYGRVNREAL